MNELQLAEGRQMYGVDPLPVDPKVNSIRVVINLFCSDSRGVTGDYYDSKEKVLSRLEDNGVRVDFEKINDPGAYMTLSTINKIKRMMLKREYLYSHYAAAGIKVTYDIHVMSHGAVEPKEGVLPSASYAPDQLSLKEASCTTCGMKHADQAMGAFQESLIQKEKPFVFMVDGQPVKIDSKSALQHYMIRHFRNHGTPRDWDGDLLSWLSPIRDIAKHPIEQISIFDQSIAGDERFQEISARVRSFAEVLNYEKRELFNVDGKKQADGILDEIFRHETANGTKEEMSLVAIPQNSPITLLSGTLYNTRKLMAKIFGNQDKKVQVANQYFSVAGDINPQENFNPFAAVGIFYANSPIFLNKSDRGVLVKLGRDATDLLKVHDKIKGDNLVRTIVGMHIDPKNIHGIVDPRPHFRHPSQRIACPSLNLGSTMKK